MANKKYNGFIELILGPMFSGKSTELLRRVNRYEIATKKCLLVNYEKSNLYSEANEVFPHGKRFGFQLDMRMDAFTCKNLNDVDKKLLDASDVIAIDEGHFFPDISIKAEEYANDGKIVLISALSGTFQRKPFPSIVNLLALAEKVQVLSSVCVGCQGEASFSFRISSENEIELIGGKEKYKPFCRKCFLEAEDKKKSSY